MEPKNIYGYDVTDFNSSFLLLKEFGRIRETDELKANEIVIEVLDAWEVVSESTKEIWLDAIDSVGFYPYLYREDTEKLDTSTMIRMNYHSSDYLTNIMLHREQKALSELLLTGKNLVVSAPTSFGKSLLIEEIIASVRYKNIVIIQPTLALLNETRKKLQKYAVVYNIIIKTTQKVSPDENNLFLLTAERVMEYYKLPKIDFVVLDEFYKISAKRDDERADVLNNAINLLLNTHKSSFYFLGPNISGISDGFAEEYNAIFYKTDYSLVKNESIDLYEQHEIGLTKSGKTKYKNELLFRTLIENINQQNIVYCSSPDRATKLAYEFYEYGIQSGVKFNNTDLPVIEWINENISRKWFFTKLINAGIGVHNGILPKHVNNSVIDYFNSGEISILFCTSTIIEGVNTTAKNVLWFDSTKGSQHQIDYFDFSNIKGRAGRLMQHYKGNFYMFNKQPPKNEVMIDIPFYDQENMNDEILINIPTDKVKQKHVERYLELQNIPEAYYETVRKNGVSIKNQLEIISLFEKLLIKNPENKCLIWNGYPTYDQLKVVINLGWEYFIKEGETTKPMNPNWLTYLTFNSNKPLNKLINERYQKLLEDKSKNTKKTDEDFLNEAILMIYKVQRHWIQYKVPKWLDTINSLQIAVTQKLNIASGDYSFYSSMLENDFIKNEYSILVEMGVPSTAIEKIQNNIPKNIGEDDVIRFIRDNSLYANDNLLEYEKQKLLELLN
ncbi:DEAD/DEAH box helicase [Enterococcus aquimarinus]|uniref:Helicase n=1 Tax=Enterococcus aquimarinus TaxID=328396 RepID=A0A1L8QP92_9ENTE|nr:DEAD/DEAH box helicase [Enterococcus aquimarinus]OJG09332.1 helicase [Enterococcus aquimarinus]